MLEERKAGAALPRLEHFLLVESTDDGDPRHGGGDVVDHRRLHHVVQLLGLQHPGVHGTVQHDEDGGNNHKSDDEVREEDADQ